MQRICVTCGTPFEVEVDRGQRFCKRTCMRYPNRTMPRRPLEERFWEKVEKTNGCWLWTARKNPGGYGWFRVDETRGSVLAHRMAYELTHGPLPDGMFACHHCDNPACVRPDHLFLGTDQDNKADMTHKGRQVKGSRMKQAKLTEDQVAEIRALYAAGGITQVELGKRYGVRDSTINRTVNRVDWRHIA